ncbi:MAG: DUF2726 domain-containing protein [Proteobacteria bacterium]|nr:DUF2726 domain-containing protein [Pseudomonadota bacterium]MCL2307989.1 DUF2726 domain-containing protein [Pseudomonadota bacterium]
MSELGIGAWIFALALVAFVVVTTIGFIRRARQMEKMQSLMGSDTVSLPGWTEGETVRLLSSAEQPGFYTLKPRFLSRIETIAFHHLKRAMPQHEVLAHVRLLDLFQLTAEGEDEKWLEAFRRIAYLDVSFVVCDGDMVIIAVVDLENPTIAADERLTRLHQAKKHALRTAHVRYISFDPLHPPAEQELRQMVLSPETMVA